MAVFDDDERRKGLPPVPPDINAHLTELQRAAVARLQGFGWSIEFVRRQGLERPVVVIVGPGGDPHGLLTEDGVVDRSTELKLR
jgi:hypothetical protein